MADDIKMYVIDEAQLDRLRRAALRLYTERRLNGDEMRDLGHLLMLIHDNCKQVEIPQ